MKKLTFLLLTLCTALAFAQPQFCEPQQKTRILMVGDSWTQKLSQYDSLTRIFAANDRPDLAAKGDITSFSGALAGEWVLPENLAKIDAELAALPDLKVVQIILGANEMLGGYYWGGWRADMTPAEETAFIDQIAEDIDTVVAHVQAANPNLKILVSFYDYMGLEEVMKDPFLAELWEVVIDSLAYPTTERLNSAFVTMAETVIEKVGEREGVDFVEFWGLMQNKYGFPNDGINPGDLELPGDITRSSPAEAMGLGGWDALHLSQEGYDHVAQYLWDNYYADQMCITHEEFAQAVSSCATGGGNPSALIRWMHKHMCD